MDEPLLADSLLALPVLLRGIRLGQPTDLAVDVSAMRVVGLEVRCGDETARFLPFPAAQIGDTAICVDSALQLLDERDLGYYRRRAASFRGMRGLLVERAGRPAGALADLVIGGDGAVVELVVVAADGERERVALHAVTGVGGRRIAPAA